MISPEILDEIILDVVRELDLQIISNINAAVATTRELPYLSEEAIIDIMAWTNFTQKIQRKTHNWKQEGF